MTILSVDCEEYIGERTKGFTGRDWLFQTLDGWLGNPAGSPIFLLEAPPGAGKTALAGRLAQFSLGQTPPPTPRLGPDFLTYAHFCRARHDSTLNPLRFVAGLSGALATRSPAFRNALQRLRQTKGDSASNFNVRLEVGEVASGARITGVAVTLNVGEDSARRAFDLLVRQPLQTLADQDRGEPFLILVDSLDEALTFDRTDHIVALLQTVGDFPPGVRFLLTSREDARVRAAVGEPALDLVADAPPESDDVLRYVSARLGGEIEFARRLAERAQGNFLYAAYVLDSLPAAQTPSALAQWEMPADLTDVYRRFLDRKLGGDTGEWLERYSPVLGAVAVGRGSGLTQMQLAAATGRPLSTVAYATANTAQYLLASSPAGPFRIYHHSFRNFLEGDPVYPIYPAEAESALAAYAWECWQGWDPAEPERYVLKYGPAHLASAAAAAAGRARHEWVERLVRLTGRPAFWERHDALVGDPAALRQCLELSVRAASSDTLPAGLLLTIRAAGALQQQRQWQSPDTLFELARAGRVEEARTRLSLLGLEQRWEEVAALVLAWLAAPAVPGAAQKVVAQTGADEPEGAVTLLRQRALAAMEMAAAPTLPALPPPPLPELVEGIIQRSGGSNVGEGIIDESLLDVQSNEMLLREDYLGEGEETPLYVGYLEGPLLVSFTQAEPARGTELLRRYIAIHAANNYVYYRNRSLWGLLQAIISHPNGDWMRQMAEEVLRAALTGSQLEFAEALPIALRALRGALAPAEAKAWLAQAEVETAETGDSWGSHTRRLASAAEALVLSDADGAAEVAGSLLDGARALRRGYAGFRAPALLTLGEAAFICDGDGERRDAVFEEAMTAAQNIQDPVFCVRTVARVAALQRPFWRRDGATATTARSAVRHLLDEPDGPLGASLHVVGERYDRREVQPGATLPLPAAAYEARTLDALSSLYQQPAVALARLNPRWRSGEILPSGALIQIPDPGFVPLLATHLAAAVLAAAGLDRRERRLLIQSLVPLAAANPTALDTIAARLVLAQSASDPELLAQLEEAADAKGEK